MKIIISIISYALILLSISFGCRNSKTDSVRIAEDKNERNKDVDTDVATFLVTACDARMMDIKEGKDAVKNGTTSIIRSYGRLMVKDQAILLRKIKKLAADRRIALPAVIGEDKEEGLQEQQRKHGKEFDEKFVKMMVIDHERDVHDFKKAGDLDDQEVRSFAISSLPLIQSHLEKIKKIKEQLN